MLKRWITLVLLMILVTGWLPMSPGQSQTPDATETVLVDSSDAAVRGKMEANGGVLLAEYESASLWQVPTRIEQTGLRDAITAVDDAILLRGITIQPRRGEPAVPTAMQQHVVAGKSMWIVQFAGPVLPEWLDGLMAAGLEIVAYLPNNAYIVWGEQPAARLNSLSTGSPLIRWQGAYHPFYRLSPDLRPDGERASLEEMVDVTIQLYQTDTTAETIARIETRAESVLRAPSSTGNLINIRVRIPSADLDEIAAWAEVLNVEPYLVPQLNDEIQGQILAGNLTSTANDMLVPSGPGYLNWLANKGFPTDPAQYPIVDVMDDGIDSGNFANILHPDFYLYGIKPGQSRIAYINNCTSDARGNAIGGHGNLNAGIVGGYNASAGAPYKDANGYSYGLGISPYGRLAGTKIFTNSGYFQLNSCDNSLFALVQNAYLAGTRITTNSWGAPMRGQYTTDSMEYDYLTRDAASAETGNQEMFHIFSAGNDGPFSETVGSPGTAKNVLTVGATENVRDQGISDGCAEPNANNAADMAVFSSRGPTMDGRSKPDLVAPGTHVMGPASQDAGFSGSGVCGMLTSKYYPNGQTLYTWSTGTSHSTPAVAGAAQLSYNYYQRVLKPGAVPSSAMQKALLINTPRYLKGISANDTLPSISQGWGMADLGALTDGTPRILKDQEHVFTSSGQTPYQITGFIADPNKPFKVSLAWSDAPGIPSAASAAVNNLNLEVIAGGQVYKGNVFNKNVSVPGGSFDGQNNVENVYLPSGISGNFRIRVYPSNIAGNAIPGNISSVDQDFALVVYNGTEAADIPVLALESFTSYPQTGNGNDAYDPGETFAVQVGLVNVGTTATEPITATITSPDPLVTLITTATSPALAPGESGTFSTSFEGKIHVVHSCFGTIPLELNISHGEFQYTIQLPDIPIGTHNNITQTFVAPNLPVSVPLKTDYVVVPIVVPPSVIFEDINVQISITHSYVGDLKLVLVNPTGLSVVLSDQNGSNGDNYASTTFDDEAETAITGSLPPYTGSFRPESPLSTFDGMPSEGTWKLEVYDFYPSYDAGTVTDFKLIFQKNQPVCNIVGVMNSLYLPYFRNEP